MQKKIRLMVATFASLLLAFAVLTGCGEMKGDINANQAPEVRFVNIHDNSAEIVYDYAPVIHWAGSDPDGFVEYYSFADITDSAAIRNPEAFIERIPEEAWIDTIATQSTVYLLSEEGEVTEHIFYVRCMDNDGQLSDVAYRTFKRTNHAPTVPEIGLTGTDETLWDARYSVADTLFSAPGVTEVYPGIQFSWRGSDPDDKTLYQIPLEFRAMLIKAPAETVLVSDWTDNTDITLIGLETGFYTLNVWSRDDGFTESVAPARAEFNVIRPTFEHNMLLVVEAIRPPVEPFNPFPPAPDDIIDFYDGLITEVAPEVSNADLELDGINVRVWPITAVGDASTWISRSLVQQYKLVVVVSDQFNSGDYQNTAFYQQKFSILEDYIEIGGRVWFSGRTQYLGALSYESGVSAQMLYDHFGVGNYVKQEAYRAGQGQAYAEWVGTVNGVDSMPELHFDDDKAGENNLPEEAGGGYLADNYGQTGVARIERLDVAQTTQYFNSLTFGQIREVENEDSEVIRRVEINNVVFDYPPTSTNCYLQANNENLVNVSRVVNWDLLQAGAPNAEGQVVVTNNDLVFISYTEEGQPWSDDDSLQVDYSYNPISEFHMKPCEIRYERVQGGTINELRYRTAISSFAYYFVVQEDAKAAWVKMLDWFFNPALNGF